MDTIPLDDSIVCRAINKEEVPVIVDNFAYTFAHDEPMGKTLKLESKDLLGLLYSALDNSLKYSRVAYDNETNEMVGAMICNEFNFFVTKSEEDNINDIKNLKAAPIISLLSSLEKAFTESMHYNAQAKILYLYATYVLPEYRRRGVASKLYHTVEKLALAEGFESLVSIATGSILQRMRSCLHFQEVCSIQYGTFLFNGSNVFSQIEDAASCILFTKRIQ